MDQENSDRVEVNSNINVRSQTGGQIIGTYFDAPEVHGNVEGSVVSGENNFVVNTNHGTIIHQQVTSQVKLREMSPRPPRPPRGFVGRVRELEEIEELISDRAPILLEGPLGIGRTTLLKKGAGGDAASEQPNGVVFLEGVDQDGKALGRDDVIQLLFDALYESTPQLKVTYTSARTYLSNTTPLVAIDRLDLNESALDNLVDLFPDAAIMIAPEGSVYSDAYEPLTVKPLSSQESVELLASKARIEVDLEDADLVAKIQSVFAGVPLALVTVANIIRDNNLSLQDALTDLDAMQTEAASPVKAAIERSYLFALGFLGEDDRRMMAMAAAAPGISASRPWLETAPDGVAAGERLENLELLQANSPRLRLHPEYASLILKEFDPDALREDLLDWLLDFIDTHALDFQEMRAELGDIIGLMDWAIARERWSDAIALGRAADPFLTLSGLWDSWRAALENIYYAARMIGDLSVQAWSMHQLGTYAFGIGNLEQAATMLNQALELRRELGDTVGEAFTQHNLNRLNPPGGPGPDSPTGNGSGTPTRAGRRLRSVVLSLIILGLFAFGALAAAYYTGYVDIPPVTRALASRGIALNGIGVAATTTPEPVVLGVALSITDTPQPTSTLTSTPAETHTPTPEDTATLTPTSTSSPTVTPTPTQTLTPTFTPTPTLEVPMATILQQSTCRYGPGTAYLYADGLFEGDTADIVGRNYAATWLYIQNHTSERYCWVSASLVEPNVDLQEVPTYQSSLPMTDTAPIPSGITAQRNGESVTIFWDQVHVNMVDARGYLLEVSICQNGLRIPVVVQTDGTSYGFQDGTNCAGSSSGKIYSVNTRGYSTPVDIPWP